MLSSEPVEVVPGNSIVEVKPQGVSKGGVVERILLEAAHSNTAHDVVVCIGDDRSDEDMYTAIEHVAVMPHMPAEVCLFILVQQSLAFSESAASWSRELPPLCAWVAQEPFYTS